MVKSFYHRWSLGGTEYTDGSQYWKVDLFWGRGTLYCVLLETLGGANHGSSAIRYTLPSNVPRDDETMKQKMSKPNLIDVLGDSIYSLTTYFGYVYNHSLQRPMHQILSWLRSQYVSPSPTNRCAGLAVPFSPLLHPMPSSLRLWYGLQLSLEGSVIWL